MKQPKGTIEVIRESGRTAFLFEDADGDAVEICGTTRFMACLQAALVAARCCDGELPAFRARFEVRNLGPAQPAKAVH